MLPVLNRDRTWPLRFVSLRSRLSVCLNLLGHFLANKTLGCVRVRVRVRFIALGEIVSRQGGASLPSIIIITKSAFASDNVSQTITNPFVPSPRRSKLPDRFLARPGVAGRCIHTIADCSAASLSFASSSLALTCSIRATAEASSRNTIGLFVERTSYVQLCPGSALVLPVLAHSRDVVAVPGCPFVPVRPHPVSACKLGN